MFTGLNSYLGNYIGEFLGELSISVFFLLSAFAILARNSAWPRWMGYVGLATAIAGLVGHVPKYHHRGGTDRRREQLSAAALDGGLRQRAIAGQSIAP